MLAMWELDFSKCWLSGNKPIQQHLVGLIVHGKGTKQCLTSGFH